MVQTGSRRSTDHLSTHQTTITNDDILNQASQKRFEINLLCFQSHNPMRNPGSWQCVLFGQEKNNIFCRQPWELHYINNPWCKFEGRYYQYSVVQCHVIEHVGEACGLLCLFHRNCIQTPNLDEFQSLAKVLVHGSFRPLLSSSLTSIS